MVVLVTCKNGEDPTKNEGTRVATTLIFRHSKAANSVVSCANWSKFEFIVSFYACPRYEE